MAVLGLLTCEILELEFAHLLANDSEVASLTVVEDQSSLGFIAAMEAEGLDPRRIPILRGYTPSYPAKLEVLVRVLELGLHNRKRILQEGLVKAAREMGHYVDALVLGYGLCGNALQDPEGLLEDAGVPVFVPMDEDHPVDDCVGLILGGRDRYYREQCRVAGTFFMIPGWTRHWKRLLEKEHGSFDVAFARRIFRHYERSLLIPNAVLTEDTMRKNIEEFTQAFGFRTEVLQGKLDILRATWHKAKRVLLQEEANDSR